MLKKAMAGRMLQRDIPELGQGFLSSGQQWTTTEARWLAAALSALLPQAPVPGGEEAPEQLHGPKAAQRPGRWL